MKSEPKKAPPRPPSPERERTDVRSPDKTASERLHEHFKGDRISFTREARRKELESEGNPVLFSADGSDELFKKVAVEPITVADQAASSLRRRHGGPIPGSISDDLQSRMIKEMGLLRNKRKRGKQTKKAKKDKKDKKTKKAKKDKKDKKSKKTKKAKKKSSK
jgi:succinate dehydrogenase/fumarate reductase flavoprotein subunit